MSQPDLFAGETPTWPAARCGNCVHRNAKIDKPTGYCLPVGRRAAMEAPCSQWFGYDQLILSLAKRPKK